jgi:hypothetical protein
VIDIEAVSQFLTIVCKEIRKGHFILEPRRDIDIGSKIINYKQALLDL